MNKDDNNVHIPALKHEGKLGTYLLEVIGCYIISKTYMYKFTWVLREDLSGLKDIYIKRLAWESKYLKM